MNSFQDADAARYYIGSDGFFEDNGDFKCVQCWVNHVGVKADGVWVNELVFEGSEAGLGVWFEKLVQGSQGSVSVSIEEVY